MKSVIKRVIIRLQILNVIISRRIKKKGLVA